MDDHVHNAGEPHPPHQLVCMDFPNPTVTTAPIPTTISTLTQPTTPTFMPFVHWPNYATPTVPVTAGGTVYYVPPPTVTTPIVYTTVAQPTDDFF